MKKCIILIFLLFFLTSCSASNSSHIVINNEKINIEIADTDKLRYNGLSNRDELCKNCGMLFTWEDKLERTFVMRDMNFSLDIIFINDDKIINISKNAVPEGSDYKIKYSSELPVNYVLEVNAGFCDKNNIKEEDNIKIKL